MTQDSPRAGARPVSGLVVVVLASMGAVAPVSTDLYLPGFPRMRHDLAASASGVQLTLTAILVGLAAGQLLMGPLSDRYGRRRPLLASATVCVLASVVCALAPTLPVLVGARLVQGLAGAGGMVIGRAVIADLVGGRAAAKAFTLVVTIGGIAPILAPAAGSLLVGSVGWRGLLWTVALLCALMLVGVVTVLRETHPPERRTAAGTSWARSAATVLGNRSYLGAVATGSLSFGMLMAYVSSSPFVFQDVVGLSAVQYGAVFGLNACGLIGFGWVGRHLLDRITPRQLVRGAIVVQLSGAAAYLVLAVAGAPVWIYPVPIFVAVSMTGVVLGNSAALAMSQVRPLAGTGSAVLGFLQFGTGALVSPLVGLGGEGSATVPALVMAACVLLGFVVTRTALPEAAADVEPVGAPAGPAAQPAASSTSTATS